MGDKLKYYSLIVEIGGLSLCFITSTSLVYYFIFVRTFNKKICLI